MAFVMLRILAVNEFCPCFRRFSVLGPLRSDGVLFVAVALIHDTNNALRMTMG